MDIGLCQPSSTILLIGLAGAIYHLFIGNMHAVIWWILVGLGGTGIFQALCYGGLEPVAWVLMAIPVLIVCFFLAVALFASRMRIDNIMSVPCDRCGHPKRKCECNKPKPRCGSCAPSGCSNRCPLLQQHLEGEQSETSE